MTRKKKITLGLIGVLLAGLAILTYIRWEVWFGNPPEAPYTAPTVPSRVLLTFGNEGALSRNVSWQCDSVLQTSYWSWATKTTPPLSTYRPRAKSSLRAAAKRLTTWRGSPTSTMGSATAIAW